jgi:UDP-N-acetylmuramate: L-alanyl-gamma-D-glutamyl-meso-diaminopimelate ligase
MQQYAKSMDPAEQAVVYFNPHVLEHKKLPPLSSTAVKSAFANQNLKVIMDSGELQSYLKAEHGNFDIILLMSSGNFDGLEWDEVFD